MPNHRLASLIGDTVSWYELKDSVRLSLYLLLFISVLIQVVVLPVLAVTTLETYASYFALKQPIAK